MSEHKYRAFRRDGHLTRGQYDALKATCDEPEFIFSGLEKTEWFSYLDYLAANPLPLDPAETKAAQAITSIRDFSAFVMLRQIYGVETMLMHDLSKVFIEEWGGREHFNLETNIIACYDVEQLRCKKNGFERDRSRVRWFQTLFKQTN